MFHYSFSFGQGERAEFEVDESGDTSLEDASQDYPAWVKLERFKCDLCTLPPGSRRTCPAALSVQPAVEAFANCFSFEKLKVEVRVDRLLFSGEIPAQNAVRSLVGLLLSLSSCPVLSRLRPMAHFHLPFGSRQHTAFRFLGMYLIAQRLRQLEGLAPDWEMGGLLDLFKQIHEVNRNLAERLRDASTQDAAINSLIILDSLAYAAEADVESSLEQLRPLYRMYF